MPQLVIQPSNLRMDVIKEVYVLNRSSLNIEFKDVKTNSDSVSVREFKFSGRHEGIITVLIPTINPISKDSQRKGIQINFDISNRKQYKMFNELFKNSNGINIYKTYKYIKPLD